MDNKFKIRLKKRSQPEFLIWLIVLMPFAFGALFELLRLPSAIKYVLDVSWILLLVLCFLNYKNYDKKKSFVNLSIWVTAFLIFTLVIYVFNYESILYYLWGLRNNFRFYAAFFAFVFFLNKEDIDYYLKAFDILFWINALVCLFQYFVMGIHQDFLGGLFGTEQGCNGYLNIFFIIITAKSIIFYLNNREKLLSCFAKCATVLLISALAELKIFYVEFLIILFVAVCITDFSVKKLLIVFSGVVGVLFATQFLVTLFPEFSGIFTVQAMWESVSTGYYSSERSLNRLNAVSYISENFLKTIPEQLFGMGLGNCDTATYSFLNTDFFTQYSYLRYSWFSVAFVFLETGYLGLIFFFGFFVMSLIYSRKMDMNKTEDKVYSQLSSIIAICCIIVGLYNSSMRTEAGYMMYFILSLPFAIQTQHNKKSLSTDKFRRI